MEIWLSKEMDRRRIIINLLLFSKSYVSIDYLITLIKISKRTLYNDVEYLNAHFGDTIKIKINKNAILLEEKPNGNIQDIFARMLHDSQHFKILDIIIKKQASSIEELAELTFFSTSTIIRRLKQINQNLSSRGLFINNKTLELEGHNPLTLHMFYIYMMIEKEGSFVWPFEKINQKALTSIIDSCCDIFDLKITTNFKNHLAYFMATLIVSPSISYDQGEHIPYEENYMYRIEKLMDKNDYLNSFPNETIKSLANLLFLVFTAFNKISKSEAIASLVDNFLGSVQEDTGLSLDKDSCDKISFIFSYIQFTHTYYPYQHFLIFNRDFYNSYSIKKFFPKFEKSIFSNLHLLEATTEVPWYTNYKSLLLHNIFIAWSHLPEKIIANRSPVKIALVTTLELDYLEKYSFFVCNTIGYMIKIILFEYNFNEYEFNKNQLLLEKADLIITNNHLNGFPEKQFIVSDVPDERQLRNLRDMVSELWIQPES